MSDTDYSNPLVRTAETGDLDLLVQLGARTFKDSFGDDNTVEDMDLYVAKAFSEEQIRAELLLPMSRFFIAEMDGQPAGYSHVREASAPIDVDPGFSNTLELVRCYACAAWIGFGVGKALMQQTLAFARENQVDGIWLGVWERNQRAIDFYQKWGFTRAGCKEFLLGNDLQTDFVMALKLDNPGG